MFLVVSSLEGLGAREGVASPTVLLVLGSASDHSSRHPVDTRDVRRAHWRWQGVFGLCCVVGGEEIRVLSGRCRLKGEELAVGDRAPVGVLVDG